MDWDATNQQGYGDGLQLYVRRSAGDFIFQLLVIGSSLKPHTVKEEW